MNILFIQPCPWIKGTDAQQTRLIFRLFLKLYMVTPPFTFPMLSALTPKHHHVTMVDERQERVDFDKKWDLVGITAMTYEVQRAYELADEFRRRGVKVILGGPHVSFMPEEAKQHADSVVIGECEEIWTQILHDCETTGLKPIYIQEHATRPELIPEPDTTLNNRFLLVGGLQTSRGCPNHCKYCCIGNSKDGKVFRKRPLDKVIAEINHSPHRILMLYDSSLTIDVEYTKQLFRALKGTHKRFILLGNINILANDDELLRLSKEAGGIQWNIGFESISPESLQDARKRTNKIEDYKKGIDKIHALKMNVHGFFMFGFDHDTPDIFDQTWKFIDDMEIDSCNFSILTPFPGTPLYEDLNKEGRIKTTDWHQYGYQKNVTFIPKKMTEQELLDGCQKLYLNYYSAANIGKRFIHSLKREISITTMLIFLMENIFSRPYVTSWKKNTSQTVVLDQN